MTSPADREMVLDLVGEAVEAGARQDRACEILELTERTLRRWKKQHREEKKLEDRRKAAANERTPLNKLTESERELIIDTCNQDEYKSMPPSQVVPILADQGIYLGSESSFYRVLREHHQNNRRGRSEPPRIVKKPNGYKAEAPNEVWSWDITYLPSTINGMFYKLYMIMDIFSRMIVGWEVHENENADHASDLIQKACLAERIHLEGLVLHSDNGSPMKGSTMLAMLQKLGVVPSFSRPSVSDDNPYSESLFRTLKYGPAYPGKPFDSIESTRLWVHDFVHWYNEEHRHSAIRYVTPGQRHRGEDKAILEVRAALYEAEKEKNPLRWSGQIRNWNRVDEVWLNPPKEVRAEEQKLLKKK